MLKCMCVLLVVIKEQDWLVMHSPTTIPDILNSISHARASGSCAALVLNPPWAGLRLYTKADTLISTRFYISDSRR
jgi:hypothetical protein